jgi:acyl-CoA thioesterase
MEFSAMVREMRHDAQGATLAIGEDWLQGRSAFGGLQAALALAAMRAHVAPTLPLRVLQTTFVAPVPPGEARAQARVLRVGRNVTHVEARLCERDTDDTKALFVGVFGEARSSAIARLPHRPEPAHAVPRPMPFVPGRSPAFVQHFAARWLEGGMPFSGDPSPRTVVEIDLIDRGPCSEAHLLALADFIPPVALSMLSTPAPGSSLTWMLELMPLDLAPLSLAGWRIDSDMVAAQDGYTSQSNRIWAPDGRLAALSRQSMVVFG